LDELTILCGNKEIKVGINTDIRHESRKQERSITFEKNIYSKGKISQQIIFKVVFNSIK